MSERVAHDSPLEAATSATASSAAITIDESPPAKAETACDRIRASRRHRDLVDACADTQRGAWSLRVVRVTHQGTLPNSNEEQLTASVALVHTDASNHTSEITPEMGPCNDGNLCRTFDYQTRYSIALAGDVDGDGEDEIVVSTHTDVQEANPVEDFRIYRFGGGAIARLAPHIEIAAMRDEDGDGVQDVVFHPYVTHALDSDCMGNSDEIDGVDFVAHATRTGYSVTDGVAKSVARKQCPSAPAKLVVPGSVASTARAIVCARVWNVPEDRIKSDLSSQCAGFTSPTCTQKAGPRDCPTDFLDWAAIDPPVHL
jgi:hypothetical protein